MDFDGGMLHQQPMPPPPPTTPQHPHQHRYSLGSAGGDTTEQSLFNMKLQIQQLTVCRVPCVLSSLPV